MSANTQEAANEQYESQPHTIEGQGFCQQYKAAVHGWSHILHQISIF